MSPAAVSQILSGKRPVSVKFTRKFLERFPVEPANLHELLAGPSKNEVTSKQRKTKRHSRLTFTELDVDHLHLLGDWYYFAIESLSHTQDFQDNAEWVAERLGITPTQARTALKRLVKLGVLTKNSSGELSPTGKNHKTSDQVSHLAVRKSHYQALELAKESLDHHNLAIRDFSAMTLTVDTAALPEAKKLIRVFRRKFARLMEAKPKKEVYRLCIQFFPLTHSDPQGAHK